MKQEDIKVWLSRISKMEDYQSKNHETWKEVIKLFKGEFFAKPTDNTGEVTEVNFTYEYIKILVSAIYAKDPYIFVRSRSGKRATFAETMQTVINYYWKELELKKKIKRIIATSALTPIGFIELGYLFTKAPKDSFTKALEEEFPELKSTKPQKTEEEIGIFDETIKEDDVYACDRSNWDVLFPDGYHNIRECPYMAVRRKVSLLDILSNPSYGPIKNELHTFATSSGSQNPARKYGLKDNVSPISMTPQDKLDLENVEITLFFVYDRRGQKRFCLAQNFDKGALFDKKWEYLPEGFPLFPLIFNEIPKTDDNAHAYPLSDVVPLLPQLKELSKISSAMMRHRKRAGTVIVIRKGSVPPEQITNLTMTKDLDIVELDNIGEDSFRNFTPAALPPDFYRLRDVIMQDLLRISGLPQLLSAGTSSVETATESENIRMGATLLQSEKVDTIEDFTRDIARYLSGLIWQYKQDKREIADIIGEDEVSEEMWPTLPVDDKGNVLVDEARRMIQKELFFDIEAGSTRPPKDENVERKLWMDLVGVINQQFPGRLNQGIILPQLLKKFDFKDIDQAIIGFDEEEAQVAQQENALLLQGVPVPISPNQNHKIHAQIHAGQVNSGQSSPALEQHLLQTVEKEQQQSPQVSGGSRGNRTSTPDIRRRGVPENVDLVGSANTPQRGINRGGG